MEDLIMIACALLAWLALGFGIARLLHCDDDITNEDADRLARQYDHDIPAGLAVLDREPAKNIFAATHSPATAQASAISHRSTN